MGENDNLFLDFKYWVGPDHSSNPDEWKNFVENVRLSMENKTAKISVRYLLDLKSCLKDFSLLDKETMKELGIYEDYSQLNHVVDNLSKRLVEQAEAHDGIYEGWCPLLYEDIINLYKESKFFELCDFISKPFMFYLLDLDWLGEQFI